MATLFAACNYPLVMTKLAVKVLLAMTVQSLDLPEHIISTVLELAFVPRGRELIALLSDGRFKLPPKQACLR